jgi:hypothetical protein
LSKDWEGHATANSRERAHRIPTKLWIVLAGMAFFFSLIISGYSASDEWSALAFLAGRVGSILALLCLASLSAIWWWKWAGSDAASERSRGIAKVLVVLSSAAALVGAFVTAVKTPIQYRVLIARQSFKNYSINVDVGTGTLLIQGTVGPGMAAEVGRQLNANAAIRTVAIDSTGGLVLEGLRIASDVQARNVTTKARNQCNSACILIFAAGFQRVAPYNFTFGFHATSSITPISGANNLATLDGEKAAVSSYLTARGVPHEFIESAKDLGPGKLYPVSAIRMADAGVVTTLLDGDHPVSIGNAKWLTVANSAGRLHEPEAFRKLLSTIEKVDPTAPEKYGPKLWAAAQAGIAGSVASATREMASGLTTRALPAADDESLALSAKATGAEMQYLRATGKWDVCAGFINGKGFGANTPPNKILEQRYLADIAIITSGAQNSWTARAVPPWASQLGAETAKDVAARMLAQGINVKNIDTDPRVSCEWSTALLATISQKPTPVAAGLYRWLAAGAK